MQAGDFLNNCQTQAATVARTARDTVETFEHLVDFMLRDTRPIIFDCYGRVGIMIQFERTIANWGIRSANNISVIMFCRFFSVSAT